MISGDNATTATAVGYQLSIPATNIIAGVLPSEKADKIRWLQSSAPRRKGKTGRAIVAWLGMGSTMLPPSLLQTQELLSALAQMLLSQVPSSC